MMSRRLVLPASIFATAILFFTFGVVHSHRTDAASRASYDAKLDAIRSDFRLELGKSPRINAIVPAGTSGRMTAAKGDAGDAIPSGASRARMVAEIKDQLQAEMGLLP